MNSVKGLEVLAQLAITSEYIMQVTMDRSGVVLSSDSGIGPVPSLFDKTQKPVHFSDCFLSTDWVKYENNRLKAWNNHHQSFKVELQKINYPSGNLMKTRWEFFFVSEDFGTCLGIGHPVDQIKPYNIQLGDFMDSEESSTEILDTLLEDKILGFWEFNPLEKVNTMSSGLAQTLGYSEKEIEENKNISWEKHIHEEDYQQLKHDIKNHFKVTGNIPFKKEFRLVSKRNQTLWTMAYGKTIQWTEGGYPKKVQGIILDITEKKKQDLWLKEHQYFLKELAFQQSHTLRARVANIMGLLDILTTEEQTGETKRLLDIIKKETTQLDQALKKSIKESVNQNRNFEKDQGQSLGSLKTSKDA
ncbi:PAS domain-containing protein [Algoriphagus machipongonensis]|uniref:histidine kinase n=1 Tax=Algoriphagus machipongonensis TaxID=388413 RepID=A3I387_9BACT|nr:PAS domain-containing protein [Algoriphagus machipongonensis]EAZ79113.1 putative PAS domain S-box [Algoriphagus machipongonensis]